MKDDKADIDELVCNRKNMLFYVLEQGMIDEDMLHSSVTSELRNVRNDK